MGSRLARWRGLLGVGWQRVHHRLRNGGSRQTLVCVLGIALPVALLLLVVSISLGLVADPATSNGADYWVVPEGASSAVTDVDSAQLGAVHPTAERVTERSDVEHASPMLVDFAVLNGPEAEGLHVLVVGVVPSESQHRVAPLPTHGLTPSDPYYANGSYDGEWTGEVVLSESAATELGVSEDGSVTPRGSGRNFTVTSVEPPAQAGLTQLPIAVVHLSELQRLTGAHETDSADQLVVFAPDGTAETERALESLYPQTTVQTRGGLLSERGTDSQLPAAMSLAALLIALTTGTLLVSTAFGFELAADRRSREVLSALGVAGRSRAAIVGTELGVVSLYGGGLGVGIWAVGLAIANRLATARFGAPLAPHDPRFMLYGIGVAMLIGFLSLPYLLVVSWRSAGEVQLR